MLGRRRGSTRSIFGAYVGSMLYRWDTQNFHQIDPLE
jgi:hypothetical protein